MTLQSFKLLLTDPRLLLPLKIALSLQQVSFHINQSRPPIINLLFFTLVSASGGGKVVTSNGEIGEAATLAEAVVAVAPPASSIALPDGPSSKAHSASIPPAPTMATTNVTNSSPVSTRPKQSLHHNDSKGVTYIMPINLSKFLNMKNRFQVPVTRRRRAGALRLIMRYLRQITAPLVPLPLQALWRHHGLLQAEVPWVLPWFAPGVTAAIHPAVVELVLVVVLGRQADYRGSPFDLRRVILRLPPLLINQTKN